MNVKPTTTRDAAVWVAIIDLNGKIFLNIIIRYPVNCIADTCTEFYRIDIDMISGGSSFNFTWRRLYEHYQKADIIIMVSPEADFESLGICSVDYNNLLFKIRDIERLLSPRKNDLPFALKFIS